MSLALASGAGVRKVSTAMRAIVSLLALGCVGASLLALVVLSLTICAGGVGAMWMVRRALAPIPTEYLTEVKLSASIQRDLLGARIFFIYFATVRKPGTKELGWKRFLQAKDELAKLRQVSSS